MMIISPVNYIYINTSPLLKGSDNTSFVYELIGRSKDEGFKFKEIRGKLFRSNLVLVESKLPEILSHVVRLSFLNEEKSLDSIIDVTEQLNPMNLIDLNSVKFYRHKVREFLKHLVLGLNSDQLYFGEPNLYDHFPILEHEGQTLYFSDNIGAFLDILLKRTELKIEHKLNTEAGRVYLELQLELILR